MENVILAVTDRKFLIGVHCALVRHHCVRAVHRLCCHCVFSFYGILLRCFLALNSICSVNALCNTGNDEHVVLIVCPVTGDEPELLVVDKRCGDLRIAVCALELSGVLHEFLVKDPAPREPVSHTRSCLTEHKEIKSSTDLLVVSLLSFLKPCKVCLELIF